MFVESNSFDFLKSESFTESLKFLSWLVEEGSDQWSCVFSKMWSLNGVVMSWHGFINLVFIFL